MDLVLFDLDRTLITGDTDYLWGDFVLQKGLVDPKEAQEKHAIFYEQYLAGNLDIEAFLRFQLKPLQENSMSDLEELRREFFITKVKPLIGKKSRELIGQHKNDLVAIVTSTNSFLAWPAARHLGVHNLIAVVPEQKNGQFTGKHTGVAPFQELKITRVELWLESLGLNMSYFKQSWFYSDSRNDLPLLKRVDKAVAVNPDEVIKQHAEDLGWQIIIND